MTGHFARMFPSAARKALEDAMVLPEQIRCGLAARRNEEADAVDLLDNESGEVLATMPARWLRPVDQRRLAATLRAAVDELEGDYRTSVVAAIERGEVTVIDEVFADCVAVSVGDWRCLIDRRGVVADEGPA